MVPGTLHTGGPVAVGMYGARDNSQHEYSGRSDRWGSLRVEEVRCGARPRKAGNHR